MTGAELKTTLSALGVPPSWFAKRLGMTMRTVVRWFDSDEIPEKAIAELKKLSDLTAKHMNRAIRQASGDPVVLYTYRTDEDIDDMPASWHRALTFRVMEHFKDRGHSVTVQYQ